MYLRNIFSLLSHFSPRFANKSKKYIQGFCTGLITQLKEAIDKYQLTKALRILELFGCHGELALAFIQTVQRHGEEAL